MLEVTCGFKTDPRRNQSIFEQPSALFARLSCYTNVCNRRQMDRVSLISARRALAILGCIALLYFAGGGVFIHQHSGGPDTVCPVCQVLHMPALAAAPISFFPEAQHVAKQVELAAIASPLDSFATHSASRAPPSV